MASPTTGPQNYSEAHHLLGQAATTNDESTAARLIATTQVHATLALAAATAEIDGYGEDGTGRKDAESRAWAAVIGARRK